MNKSREEESRQGNGYEDVFEISGDTPLNVKVDRRHSSGDTLAWDVVEESGWR